MLQAGLPLPRLMHEYGHCVVARELFQGSTTFDAFISVLESITGQVCGCWVGAGWVGGVGWEAGQARLRQQEQPCR